MVIDNSKGAEEIIGKKYANILDNAGKTTSEWASAKKDLENPEIIANKFKKYIQNWKVMSGGISRNPRGELLLTLLLSYQIPQANFENFDITQEEAAQKNRLQITKKQVDEALLAEYPQGSLSLYNIGTIRAYDVQDKTDELGKPLKEIGVQLELKIKE